MPAQLLPLTQRGSQAPTQPAQVWGERPTKATRGSGEERRGDKEAVSVLSAEVRDTKQPRDQSNSCLQQSQQPVDSLMVVCSQHCQVVYTAPNGRASACSVIVALCLQNAIPNVLAATSAMGVHGTISQTQSQNLVRQTALAADSICRAIQRGSGQLQDPTLAKMDSRRARNS